MSSPASVNVKGQRKARGRRRPEADGPAGDAPDAPGSPPGPPEATTADEAVVIDAPAAGEAASGSTDAGHAGERAVETAAEPGPVPDGEVGGSARELRRRRRDQKRAAATAAQAAAAAAGAPRREQRSRKRAAAAAAAGGAAEIEPREPRRERRRRRKAEDPFWGASSDPWADDEVAPVSRPPATPPGGPVVTDAVIAATAAAAGGTRPADEDGRDAFVEPEPADDVQGAPPVAPAGPEDDVGDDLEGDIEGDIEGDLEDEADDETEDDLEGDIGDETGDDLEGETGDDLEGDIGGETGDDVEGDIGDEIEDDTADDTGDDTGDEGAPPPATADGPAGPPAADAPAVPAPAAPGPPAPVAEPPKRQSSGPEAAAAPAPVPAPAPAAAAAAAEPAPPVPPTPPTPPAAPGAPGRPAPRPPSAPMPPGRRPVPAGRPAPSRPARTGDERARSAPGGPSPSRRPAARAEHRRAAPPPRSEHPVTGKKYVPREVVLRQRRRRRRTIIGTTVLLAVVNLVVGSAYAYFQWRLDQINRVPVGGLAEDVPGEVMNVLLVGSDSREGLTGQDAAQAGQGQVEGQRSDTIMVLHVDPRQQRAAILAVPRDLYVPIPGTDGSDRVNTAFSIGGAERLIAALGGIGIQVNHYAEVDFVGFKEIVDAIGGVPVYLPHWVRDFSSGLDVPRTGCVDLNGTQALAYVRSRQFESLIDGRWVTDPRGDLGRIERQQDFIRRVMKKGVSTGITNPFALNRLIGIGVRNLTVDDTMSTSDITNVARRFRTVDPGAIETLVLPTAPQTIDGKSVLVLQDQEAQDEIAKINGTAPLSPPTTAPNPAAPGTGSTTPPGARLQVLNGNGRPGIARTTADALESVGFQITDVGDTPTVSRTVVRYATGKEATAKALAANLAAGGDIRADASITSADVVLVLGADYKGFADPNGTPTTVAGRTGGTSPTAPAPAPPPTAAPATTAAPTPDC